MTASILSVLALVWAFTLIVGAILSVVVFWDVRITALLAPAGLVTVIAGFAARDAIANSFGSVALFLDGTYEVGDYIALESRTAGRVIDVSIRSTVLKTPDSVLVTVPNSDLHNARIVNESTPEHIDASPSRWAWITAPNRATSRRCSCASPGTPTS